MGARGARQAREIRERHGALRGARDQFGAEGGGAGRAGLGVEPAFQRPRVAQAVVGARSLRRRHALLGFVRREEENASGGRIDAHRGVLAQGRLARAGGGTSLHAPDGRGGAEDGLGDEERGARRIPYAAAQSHGGHAVAPGGQGGAAREPAAARDHGLRHADGVLVAGLGAVQDQDPASGRGFPPVESRAGADGTPRSLTQGQPVKGTGLRLGREAQTGIARRARRGQEDAEERCQRRAHRPRAVSRRTRA